MTTNKELGSKLDKLIDVIGMLAGAMQTKQEPPKETIEEEHEFHNPIQGKKLINTKGGRPNYFEDIKSGFTSAEKTEIDRAGEEDRKAIDQMPTPRTRKSNLVKVQCKMCGKKDNVSPTTLSPRSKEDPDGGAGTYRCNSCIRV